MTIRARYHGKCSKCGQGIKPGQSIEWVKGAASQVHHTVCGAVVSEAALATFLAAPLVGEAKWPSLMDTINAKLGPQCSPVKATGNGGYGSDTRMYCHAVYANRFWAADCPYCGRHAYCD